MTRLLPFVATLLVCGVAHAQTAARTFQLPTPTGPHAVGVVRYAWTDSSRDELGTPEADRRAILVRIWYPAKATRSEPAPYLPQLESYRASGSIGARTAELLRSVTPVAVADAPPVDGPAIPTILFSPGNGEREFMYTALAQELASHGYAFVLIVHPGVSDVVFPDGRALRRYRRLFDPKPEGWEESIPQTYPANLKRALYDTMYTEAARYLTADVSFALDMLQRLNADPKSRFHRRLGLDRVATFGHSYGGNVAVEACARDARVVACLQADGGAFGPVRDEGLRKPYMLFRPAHVNDGWPRGVAQDHLFGSLRSDGYEVNITRAVHRSFMDAHFLSPDTSGQAILPERALTIVSAYTRAFLARYLGGRDSALLAARSADFPEVGLRTLRVDAGAKR